MNDQRRGTRDTGLSDNAHRQLLQSIKRFCLGMKPQSVQATYMEQVSQLPSLHIPARPSCADQARNLCWLHVKPIPGNVRLEDLGRVRCCEMRSVSEADTFDHVMTRRVRRAREKALIHFYTVINNCVHLFRALEDLFNHNCWVLKYKNAICACGEKRMSWRPSISIRNRNKRCKHHSN